MGPFGKTGLDRKLEAELLRAMLDAQTQRYGIDQQREAQTEALDNQNYQQRMAGFEAQRGQHRALVMQNQALAQEALTQRMAQQSAGAARRGMLKELESAAARTASERGELDPGGFVAGEIMAALQRATGAKPSAFSAGPTTNRQQGGGLSPNNLSDYLMKIQVSPHQRFKMLADADAKQRAKKSEG